MSLGRHNPTHKSDQVSEFSLINTQNPLSSLHSPGSPISMAPHLVSFVWTPPLLPDLSSLEYQSLHSKHISHSESLLLEVIHALTFPSPNCQLSLILTSPLSPRPKCPTVYLK